MACICHVADGTGEPIDEGAWPAPQAGPVSPWRGVPQDSRTTSDTS